MVLLMSVNPGYAAQSFIQHSVLKVAKLKQMITARGLPTLIKVDDGMNKETARPLLDAGADVLVAGSSIFKSSNPIETIRELKAI